MRSFRLKTMGMHVPMAEVNPVTKMAALMGVGRSAEGPKGRKEVQRLTPSVRNSRDLSTNRVSRAANSGSSCR